MLQIATNCPLAEEARDALRRHVLEPLLPRCMDAEYGGFLVDFDHRWRSIGPHEKSLEHAARMTSSFALLEAAFPNLGCNRLVRHGCKFLEEMMWDKVDGGFFARVDRSGHPLLEGLKHPHGVTYAGCAFLLAEPYLDRGEGLAWAKRAFGWMEEVAWDRDHGGYWGSFDRTNKRYPAGTRLPTGDGRDPVGCSAGFKEINTHSDALEMLALFKEHQVDPRCAERFAEWFDLIVDRLIDCNGLLPYLWSRDWRPLPELLRVGYQFTTARRLLAPACRAERPEAAIAAARKLVDFCLAFARHPSGGFCYAITAGGRTWPATGPSTDQRQWWVQFEALRVLHLLACLQSVEPQARAEYRQERDQQWNFVREAFFDERYQGIREVPLEHLSWPARVSLWPGKQSNEPQKTHGWKDPLHEVEAFLALAGS